MTCPNSQIAGSALQYNRRASLSHADWRTDFHPGLAPPALAAAEFFMPLPSVLTIRVPNKIVAATGTGINSPGAKTGKRRSKRAVTRGERRNPRPVPWLHEPEFPQRAVTGA